MPRMKIMFLPGAGGSAGFWRPLAKALQVDGEFCAWPGLGDEPPAAGIASLDDLTAMVLAKIDGPTAILAQSMGGVVALRAALAAPGQVKKLVLAATSGGVPVADLGAEDWRPAYFAAFPSAARWIGAPAPDLSTEVTRVSAPSLLLWGDADPISPPAVGRRLQALLPRSRLEIIHGADHDLVRTHVPAVAKLIARHLAD